MRKRQSHVIHMLCGSGDLQATDTRQWPVSSREHAGNWFSDRFLQSIECECVCVCVCVQALPGNLQKTSGLQ